MFDDPRLLVWSSAMNECMREALTWIVGKGKHVIPSILRPWGLENEACQTRALGTLHMNKSMGHVLPILSKSALLGSLIKRTIAIGLASKSSGVL